MERFKGESPKINLMAQKEKEGASDASFPFWAASSELEQEIREQSGLGWVVTHIASRSVNAAKPKLR